MECSSFFAFQLETLNDLMTVEQAITQTYRYRRTDRNQCLVRQPYQPANSTHDDLQGTAKKSYTSVYIKQPGQSTSYSFIRQNDRTHLHKYT